MMKNSSASRQALVSNRAVMGSLMWARAVSIALAVLFSLVFDATAHNALVIDMNRVRVESRAGEEIRAASEELRGALREEIRVREEVIRQDERKLADERGSLQPAEFRERVRAFEGKVIEQRKFAEEQSRRLQFAMRRAQAQLGRATQAVLAEIMKQAGAELLFDKTQIVLVAEEYDITDEVISRLNEVVEPGTFKELEAPPEE